MFAVEPATGLVIEANPAAERLTGYDRPELVGMNLGDLHPLHDFVRDPKHSCEGSLQSVRCRHSTLGHKNGESVPIVFSSSERFAVDGRELVLWVFREMSDLEMHRHRLATLQWALSAYGGVALALVQADSSEGLLQAICEAITRESAYVLAWVGTAEELPGKPVRFIASSGRAKDSLEGLRVSWDDQQDTGNGTAGMAIRTGAMHIIDNVETAEHYAPWREWARRIGVQSLIGIPLTGGFFGKFYIFRAAVESNLIWLTVLGLLNSAVAAYYYLRLLVVMYFNEPGEVSSNLEPLTPGLRAALILPAVGTVVLGVLPGAVLDFAQKSASFVR